MRAKWLGRALAPSAACRNPSGSGCGSIPVRHSWRLGPAHESTAHRAVDCPACGSAVLFESLRVLNKKKTPCQQTRSFAFYGPGGIRTLDLSDANRTLSQLSYRPMSLRLNQCNPFCAKSQEQNKNFVGPKGDRSCNIRFLLQAAIFRTLIALRYK